jgi:spore maturation protein CgeB
MRTNTRLPYLPPAMKQLLKRSLLASDAGRAAYALAQEAWFHHTFRRRRERYEALVRDQPEALRADAAIRRAREALRRRGYTPPPRDFGSIHTFAFLPSHWQHQNQIAQALTRLGPCTRFDYTRHGFQLAALRTSAYGHTTRRSTMHELLLRELDRAHKQRPIDWFFAYALGWDMTPEVLRRIRETIGVPTVNISLDDKNWWDEIERGDRASALRTVVPHFDLGWTSARAAVPWYWAEGGQALFLPEGVNSDWFRPMPNVPQDVKVGFVGNRFGRRPEIIDALVAARIPVSVYGNNWPSGALPDADMLRFFNSCVISLGIGDMHFSKWLTNLKGRDFEIPSIGRSMYLTTYNSDLASCFLVGRDIQCFRGTDELIELVRYYLHNQEEAQMIAAAGRERCLRDHQWVSRFEVLLRALGILPVTA